YVDRNADGDLTGKDERILKRAVCAVDIPTGPREWCSLEVKDRYGPDKQQMGHTISYSPDKGKKFAQKTVGVLVFADRPQDAPVVHFGGPLTLTIFDWYKPLQPRQISRSDQNEEFSILVGTPVIGGQHETFAMIDGYFPDLAGPEKMPTVVVELPGKKLGDKEIVPKVTLRYCECRRRFWFAVRVPAEAGKGKAKVTLSFPDWKEVKICPATFELPIVEFRPE